MVPGRREEGIHGSLVEDQFWEINSSQKSRWNRVLIHYDTQISYCRETNKPQSSWVGKFAFSAQNENCFNCLMLSKISCSFLFLLLCPLVAAQVQSEIYETMKPFFPPWPYFWGLSLTMSILTCKTVVYWSSFRHFKWGALVTVPLGTVSNSGKGGSADLFFLQGLPDREAAGALMRKRKCMQVPSAPSRPGLDRSVV